MKSVRAKKKLGQHFLKDLNIARKISETLTFDNYKKVIEIGPGMGVLTRFLIEKTKDLHLIEIDSDSVNYLKDHYKEKDFKLIEGDFLKLDIEKILGPEQFAIIGNFPYNISTQIIFKTLEHRNQIPFFSGMFQKEVAERVASQPGNKNYGIISVLLQAYYDIEYLFTVNEEVFTPPPKVKSGVIRLIRRENQSLDCDEKLFKRVIKTAFNQRRKTLRNALKSITLVDEKKAEPYLVQRAEQLSVDDFIQLTQSFEA